MTHFGRMEELNLEEEEKELGCRAKMGLTKDEEIDYKQLDTIAQNAIKNTREKHVRLCAYSF